MAISFGSICSGIEGASVALNGLGFKAQWFSEVAPFPCRLLSEKYPDIQNLGDMRQIPDMLENKLITAPDMICGGTPCQAFSYAGYQHGLADDRGNLTLTFVDIADRNDTVRHDAGLRPSVILWENVEGVLADKTNAFGCFISSLAGTGKIIPMNGRWPQAGILRGEKRTVAWRVLDAKYFGIPQQRRRLYVVAGEDSIHPEKILIEPRNDDKPSADYPKDPELEFIIEGHRFEIFRAYTDCLFSSYGTKWNGNASANNGSLFVVQDNRLRRLSPIECERLMGFPDNYTDLNGASMTARYQALGNSWAIPVIAWIGKRILTAIGHGNENDISKWQGSGGYDFQSFEGKDQETGSGKILNCSAKPNECNIGDMREIVSVNNIQNIYLSPVGCAGIIRRSEERHTTINKRLFDILRKCSETMPEEEITRRSMIQKRGKLSNI